MRALFLVATLLLSLSFTRAIWDNSEIKVWNIGMLMSGMKSSRSSCLFHHSMIFPILRLTKKKRLLNLSAVVLPLIMSLENGSSRKECLYKKNFCHTLRESVNNVILRSSPLHGLLGKQQLRAFSKGMDSKNRRNK